MFDFKRMLKTHVAFIDQWGLAFWSRFSDWVGLDWNCSFQIVNCVPLLSRCLFQNRQSQWKNRSLTWRVDEPRKSSSCFQSPVVKIKRSSKPILWFSNHLSTFISDFSLLFCSVSSASFKKIIEISTILVFETWVSHPKRHKTGLPCSAAEVIHKHFNLDWILQPFSTH